MKVSNINNLNIFLNVIKSNFNMRHNKGLLLKLKHGGKIVILLYNSKIYRSQFLFRFNQTFILTGCHEDL